MGNQHNNGWKCDPSLELDSSPRHHICQVSQKMIDAEKDKDQRNCEESLEEEKSPHVSPTKDSRIVNDGVKPIEVLFEPPWDTKIGQLQYTCQVLRRFSRQHIDSRNDVIIRCYPQRNIEYMRLVWEIVRKNCDNEKILYPKQLVAVPLPYEIDQDGQTVSMKVKLGGTKTEATWVVQSRMLVRATFHSQIHKEPFIETFNKFVKKEFAHRQNFSGYIAPFAHEDLTYPERKLRLNLVRMCREKNTYPGEKVYNLLGMDRYGHQPPPYAHYYHDGIKLWKRIIPYESFGSAVMLCQYTEEHLLQNAVSTLHKYATTLEQKRASVILQGFKVTGSGKGNNSADDTQSIKELISKVTNSHEFKIRIPDSESVDEGAFVRDITRVSRRQPLPVVTASTGTQAQVTGTQSQEQHSQPPPIIRIKFTSEAVARAFVLLFNKVIYKKEEPNDEGEESDHDNNAEIERSKEGDDTTSDAEIKTTIKESSNVKPKQKKNACPP